MDFSAILVGLILVVDFVISVWNCYASGFNAAILQKQPSDKLRYALLAIVNGAGLLIGFAGAAYVVTIVLAFLAYSTGYLASSGFNFILAFDFIIFGGLITWFGIIITIHSIIFAFTTGTWADWAVSIWNTIASIWDAVLYLRNFGTMFQFVKEEGEEWTAIVVLVIAAAVGIGEAIAYAAYHMGLQRGGAYFAD